MRAVAPTGRTHDDARDGAVPEDEGRAAGWSERFAEVYRGRHDPVDALWWADHPDADGPSGAPAPSAPLAGLRRAVYSGRGTPADTAALGALLTQLERDRADTEAALAAASPPVRQQGAETTSPGASAASMPRADRRRRTLVLAAAALAGLAVGAAVALGRAGGPADTGTASAGTIGTVLVTAHAPLSALQRPPTAADRTAALLGPDLVASSLRRVASTHDPAAVFYLGRDRAGEVCLIATATYYSASCAPDSIAGTRGLALAWSGADRPDGSGGSGAIVAVLDPAGRLRIGRSS